MSENPKPLTQSEPYVSGPSPKSVVYDPSAWLRLPRPGDRCPVSALSRSGLVELIKPCERNGYNPPVVARHLKAKGSDRGVILIDVASLRAFLNGLPTLAESYAAESKKLPSTSTQS